MENCIRHALLKRSGRLVPVFRFAQSAATTQRVNRSLDRIPPAPPEGEEAPLGAMLFSGGTNSSRQLIDHMQLENALGCTGHQQHGPFGIGRPEWLYTQPPSHHQLRSMLSIDTPGTSQRSEEEMLRTTPFLLLSLFSAAQPTVKQRDNGFPGFVKDMQSLNHYMEQFFTVENEETSASWDAKLPTTQETQEIRELIQFLYQLERFDKCVPELLHDFPALAKWMNITLFEGNFCVVHERIPQKAPFKFPRAFGYAVLASPQIVDHHIHHSAAHFQSDGQVCQQAATLFQWTKSRSLVVAGASRYAINGTHPSLRNGSSLTPDQQSSCQKAYTKSDAAHNVDLLFHHINAAIRDVSKALGEKSTFIQWHGMAETSCIGTDAFVSAGGSGDCPIYNSIGSTPNRISTAFNLVANGMTAGTPRTETRCKLTGASNVFGRYIYGVPSDLLCVQAADKEAISGDFIHIEQKRATRSALDTWSKAIDFAFRSTTDNRKLQLNRINA